MERIAIRICPTCKAYVFPFNASPPLYCGNCRMLTRKPITETTRQEKYKYPVEV